MSSCQIRCTRQPNLYPSEDGQNIRPKHVAVVYNKYKITVQLVGGEICIRLWHGSCRYVTNKCYFMYIYIYNLMFF